MSNLHSVWDSVIYNYPGYPVMPLSETDWDWYSTTADTIATNNSISGDNLMEGDFMGWANESYNLAINYVYPGFTTG